MKSSRYEKKLINKPNRLTERQDKAISTPPKYFYIFLILIPVLFITILESALRIFNYGTDNRQWVHVTAKTLVLNPEIARRYFYSTKNIPTSINDIFDEVKAPNAFRVFVLGESSAAGYPYMPVGSFSRYLQKRLELVYPDTKIEVVNIAMTAIGSYTLRDLFPGVVEQKPDLVIIYTGHNEYYGALGIGSNESLGSSRFLINTALYLNRFKIFEMLRNTIKNITVWFSSNSQSASSGTLMSRIVKDQYIPYNSEKFKAGLQQFEGNMKEILEMAKENEVPVILGTLTSNLKDQHPFISIKKNNLPSAEDIFNRAKELLTQKKYNEASALFRKAKDLDALRFRAPEEINKIIFQLAHEYKTGIVNIDSVFNAVSPGGITGNNIMTDHLHPALEGYKLIGKLYYEKMEQINILPKTNKVISNSLVQDSLASANFNFSSLDSTISIFRIKSLKNDWPFIQSGKVKSQQELFPLKNLVDSLAIDVVNEKLKWETAQKRLADFYLRKNDIPSFIKQINVLISQFPFITRYYDYAAGELLRRKDFDNLYTFCKRRYKIESSGFSTKWLGIIELSKGQTDRAIKYLEESLKYNSSDSQVLFNLSGAYSKKEEYDKALSTINLCLSYNPGFPGAKVMQAQLSAAVNK